MYDGFAEEYLAHASEGAYNAYYDRPAVLEVLGSVRGSSVLDVGCGPGLYVEELLARGAGRVVGVDGSAEMLRLARRRLAGSAGRVVLHCQDLQVPLVWAGDGEFDVAVMALVIHHLDDRVAALREIARVLRAGGRLVVSTHHPIGDWLRHGGSYFTVEKINELRRGWPVAYWRQPLQATCDEFAAGGFLIERVHEPRPSAAMYERYPDDAAKLSINPGFVVFALLKR
jgi:ubiquinone/menaquinone biosynthesis C-methylase UbiE